MTLLLNPGPVVLSKRVYAALTKPALCHREQEFVDLQNAIRKQLLQVYQLTPTQWAGIVFSGSGTAAMEAMMTSLVPLHGKVLIIENGLYGERLTHIAKIHDIDHIVLHHEWGEQIDLQRLENELRYHEELSHVALVHHETTTGRLNDIAAISALCRRYNDCPILLDAISSFGAEDIQFEKWNIAAAAATANKCLHGAPGVSFVLANRAAMTQMVATPARTLYLDLAAYLKNQDANTAHFTQSIPIFYALAEALAEFSEAGGWQGRQAQYQALMGIVDDGLARLNIKRLLARTDCSCVLNAFHLPRGVSYQTLHDQLKAAGFVIYAGQGGLAKSFFRISCMGAVTAQDLHRLIDEIEKIV